MGATTRAGQLTAPLRDRFGVILRLELYTAGAAHRDRHPQRRQFWASHAKPRALWKSRGRSRGTPRIANRLLKRVRDFAQVLGDGVITREIADEALRRQEIDQLGLDAIDRRMLTTIIRNYGGGPVGLETLAAAIGEESVTLEDVYEPYLMQIGFLSRTPRGRCATPLAYEHLGLTPNGRPQPAPEADQLSLLEDK